MKLIQIKLPFEPIRVFSLEMLPLTIHIGDTELTCVDGYVDEYGYVHEYPEKKGVTQRVSPALPQNKPIPLQTEPPDLK